MKQWIQSLLYVPKHQKPTDENILRLLMPSVIGAVLCMVCLAGTTWAWFSASMQTELSAITAAEYTVSVTITDENQKQVEKSPEGGYALSANTAYSFTLEAGGSAKRRGGYFLLENTAGETYCTQSVMPGESLQFTLIPATNDLFYTVTAVWGVPKNPQILPNTVIGEKAPAEPAAAEPPAESPAEPAAEPPAEPAE